MLLSGSDGETRGEVHTDLRISGKAAAMGQSVIADVAKHMTTQFSDNLQAMLEEEPMAGSRGGVVPDDTPNEDERSGATVAEAVEVASAGSQHGGVERPPEDAEAKTSPVEQTAGDEAMTEGRVTRSPGDAGGPGVDVPSTRMPPAPVGGGAQSMGGARVSDPVSASGNKPRPAWAPTDTPDTSEDAALDGLALARSIVAGRLADPKVRIGLGVVALLFLLRRGGGKRRAGTVTVGQARYSVKDLEDLVELLERNRKS